MTKPVKTSGGRLLNAIKFNPNLKPLEKWVLAVFASNLTYSKGSDFREWRFMAISGFMEETGLSKRGVMGILDKLVAKGYLEKEREVRASGADSASYFKLGEKLFDEYQVGGACGAPPPGVSQTPPPGACGAPPRGHGVHPSSVPSVPSLIKKEKEKKIPVREEKGGNPPKPPSLFSEIKNAKRIGMVSINWNDKTPMHQDIKNAHFETFHQKYGLEPFLAIERAFANGDIEDKPDNIERFEGLLRRFVGNEKITPPEEIKVELLHWQSGSDSPKENPREEKKPKPNFLSKFKVIKETNKT
jgi:DNA-binding MarR family transcriptional regulator